MSETTSILITAGPTHEPIDAVRYIANRSSGRMGIAIAEAAARRGHLTTLLLGPSHLSHDQSPNTSQTTVVRFQTTADLQLLLTQHWPYHDVLIMAAAVADYRPAPTSADESHAGKLRRTGKRISLELEPTPDLLAHLAETTRPGQTVIGFALEPTGRLMASAADKLKRKSLHAIVANPLETMDAETVTATLLLRDGHTLTPPPTLPKKDFADWLLEQLPLIRRYSVAE